MGIQSTTPVKLDNGTAAQSVSDTIKNEESKLWDIRYHWISEKQKVKQFQVYSDKVSNNLAGYHTKHHSQQIIKI